MVSPLVGAAVNLLATPARERRHWRWNSIGLRDARAAYARGAI
jgi:hypothetical protein